MTIRNRKPGRIGAIAPLAVVLAIAVSLTAAASARTGAVPRNTAPPTILGEARQGQTLTTENGTWDNSPTSFTYQWQRCSASGSGCADISAATSKSYTPTAADVDNTLRVVVTAINADGQSNANSQPTALVSSTSAPTNTAKPTITGRAVVGEELSASTGTWTGGVRSYTYQWQRCSSSTSCTDVSGATARTYGVRSADAGSSLRVGVTAHNLGGTATAYSDTTAVVASAGGTTTVTQTTVTQTVRGNRAPTISWVSLRRAGFRIYARFRVCDDSPRNVSVISTDTKPGVRAYSRRFSVPGQPCGTSSRNWLLPARFRGHGRYTARLRAIDKSGAQSRTVSRSLNF